MLQTRVEFWAFKLLEVILSSGHFKCIGFILIWMQALLVNQTRISISKCILFICTRIEMQVDCVPKYQIRVWYIRRMRYISVQQWKFDYCRVVRHWKNNLNSKFLHGYSIYLNQQKLLCSHLFCFLIKSLIKTSYTKRILYVR